MARKRAGSPTVEELAIERQRFQRRFAAQFGYLVGLGTVLYVATALLAASVRGVRHQRGVLARINLGLSPTEGISIIGAFLAVVVSINIALAAQQIPTDPRERLRNADWAVSIALISSFSAIAAVLVGWGCWLSTARNASWGACFGLSLMALVTAALASAIRVRSQPAEALLAEEHLLGLRRHKLNRALSGFRTRHPFPDWGWPRITLGCLGCGVLLGLLTTAITYISFGYQVGPMRGHDLALLALAASVLDAPLVYCVSRVSWLVPATRDPFDAMGEFWFLLATYALAVGLAAAVLTTSRRLLPSAAVYCGCYLALPLIAVALDRWLGWLSWPLRAATGRSLQRKLDGVTAELRQLRKQVKAG